MSIDQKFNFNFNFDIAEPKQKNNIVVFFLRSKVKMKDDLITFPYAIKNNLAEVEEINEKAKKSFKNIVVYKPRSSKKASKEIYIFCKGILKIWYIMRQYIMIKLWKIFLYQWK